MTLNMACVLIVTKQITNPVSGWTMALTEYMETIPTLWNATQQFMSDYPEYVQRGNESLLGLLTDDDYASYNGCHFWSNFEVRTKPITGYPPSFFVRLVPWTS